MRTCPAAGLAVDNLEICPRRRNLRHLHWCCCDLCGCHNASLKFSRNSRGCRLGVVRENEISCPLRVYDGTTVLFSARRGSEHCRSINCASHARVITANSSRENCSGSPTSTAQN